MFEQHWCYNQAKRIIQLWGKSGYPQGRPLFLSSSHSFSKNLTSNQSDQPHQSYPKGTALTVTDASR